MDYIHYIKEYIKYILCARHYRGDGVHSPFVYGLIRNIFREENGYYAYRQLEKIRDTLLYNDTEIEVKDFGTGKSGRRKISDIAHKSLKNRKYAQLLFRLINEMKPQTVLELGTSLGLTTMYLAAPNTKAQVFTLEGCPAIAAFAKKLFGRCKFNNIESRCGNINETLPAILNNVRTLDFVFFDANHQKEATLNYFRQCVEKIGEKAVFVFDDIYWSKGMTAVWREIKQHSRVRVSIDIFEMGILFFDTELQNGDYKIRF
ncbi:O-methyltransferase [Bacteroidia bacterium]|nr:O-methyltransferase [Bacteroidia bacterium]